MHLCYIVLLNNIIIIIFSSIAIAWWSHSASVMFSNNVLILKANVDISTILLAIIVNGVELSKEMKKTQATDYEDPVKAGIAQLHSELTREE